LLTASNLSALSSVPTLLEEGEEGMAISEQRITIEMTGMTTKVEYELKVDSMAQHCLNSVDGNGGNALDPVSSYECEECYTFWQSLH
jgi:hypothetical protein